MSYSIGRLGRVACVQDEVIIQWDEIANRPTLVEAFAAGEIYGVPDPFAQDRLNWDRIAPGLWMLTAGGDNTGIMITEGK